MSTPRWERLKALFYQALDQPPARRQQWLAEACGGDRSLLQEIEALLAAHDSTGDFLEQPARIEAGAADAAALGPGSALGPYLILEELGRGGMGIVYLAEDRRLGRRVAIKALAAPVAADAQLRERLRREARAAATIAHPAVAAVYALEEIDDALFIVSEYVRGRTLRSVLERGPLEPVRARAVAIDVARALCAAHDAGVVHRDLKPDNVLLTEDGRAKVVDFGIAYIHDDGASRLTRAGALMGTLAYMAPEQLLGGFVDARADIYSFGVVLREMLTGRHPADARAAAPTSSDAALAAIAARCLQADPAARFGSARALLHALEGAAGRDDGTARWWWEFHQAAVSAAYVVLLAVLWSARPALGSRLGGLLFLAAVIAAATSATFRLHLWFTSRSYPDELPRVRRRARRPVHVADGMFSATLLGCGLLIRDQAAAVAAVLAAGATAVALALLVIEPVTTRAAFREASISEV